MQQGYPGAVQLLKWHTQCQGDTPQATLTVVGWTGCLMLMTSGDMTARKSLVVM
jgi:hypothetical protein